MAVWQALVLGAVQGIAELLPISSSAHLVLVPWLLGWPAHSLAFDVALHVGTLLAVIAYFWRDWLTLIGHGLGRGLSTREGRMFWFIAAASIPGGLAGLALETQAETAFRNPLSIAALLVVMGILLQAADRWGAKRNQADQAGFGQSMIIGFAQALAILPGVSRSGATMTAGLMTGMTREGAARFSFLLATPIMAAAGVYKLSHLFMTPGAIDPPFLVGVGASALVGAAAIGFLLRWVRRNSFAPFAWYRFFLGAFVLAVYVLRRG